MSKRTPVTPQSRRPNKINVRATMASADISIAVPSVSANRRLPFTRQSMFPNMTVIENDKKVEQGNKDVELKSLYNKYLQTEMIKILMKKKTKEMEKTVVIQLASLMKEESSVKRELCETQLREKELKKLIDLQDSLNEQLNEIKACLGDFNGKVSSTLTELQLLLENLDVLKCSNIIIPETEEEMVKLREQLEKCASLLYAINKAIGLKRDALVNTGKSIQEFNKTYSEIQDYSKRCGEALEQLQIRCLKEGACALTMARPNMGPGTI